MKSKIYVVIFVAIVTIVTSYNVYTTQINTSLSDLALVNIEALAQNEDSIKYYSAVKGDKVSNGSLKRTKDDYGRCIFSLLMNVTDTGDCTM